MALRRSLNKEKTRRHSRIKILSYPALPIAAERALSCGFIYHTSLPHDKIVRVQWGESGV
ncbi:MAG: hypothetical protein ACLFNU_12330 [Bacteroidales bacterium]